MKKSKKKKVSAVKNEPDLSRKENQIGCGYCDKETTCLVRDPRINKAKLGCVDFVHHEDSKK